MRFSKKIAAASGLMLLLLVSTPTAFAANKPIVGGTNGAGCDSGGYFTPSTATISSGDTITISVPSNDPYPDGMEVFGFPGGSFTIARGSSHTTGPITSNVSYYGTWPGDTRCMKGSGIITVAAVAPAPAATPAATKPASGSTTPAPTPATTSPTTTSPTTTSNNTTPTTSPKSATPAPVTKSPGAMSTSAKTLTISGILVALVLAGLGLWYFVARRRSTTQGLR